MKNDRRLSLRKLLARVGLCLGAVVLAAAVFILIFGGMILNRYGKGKMERAYAKAHPGGALHIGKFDYSVGADRLVAQTVTLSAPNMFLKADRISLTGARWTRFLWGTVAPAEVLDKASLEATNLDVEFPHAHYGIRYARLQASVLDSELIAEETELLTLGGDEAFSSAYEFQTPRFHVIVPE